MKCGGAKEDGLRRQWGLSVSDKEGEVVVQRLPSAIEYKPVMDAINKWWKTNRMNPGNNETEVSWEKLLKTYWVDFMVKEDYVQVANECAKLLVDPENP